MKIKHNMNFVIGEYNIHLQENVLNIFRRFKQIDKHLPESGGILLGQIENKNIYFLKASIPNKFDRGSRFSFIRDKDAAQIIVDYEFANSLNKTIYLGEWHTHPEHVPSPSPQDKKMIKEQFSKNSINEGFVFLFIAGLSKLFISVYNGKDLIVGCYDY